MAISDTQKIDLLFKKLAYGVTKTHTTSGKLPSNEAIASPLPVYGHAIWSQADQIPFTPPGSTTPIVQPYTGSGNAVQLKVDPTVTANSTWVAVEDFGEDIDDANRMTDWIPFSFGANYAVKLWVGGPPGSGTQKFPDTTNEEFIFDYQAGVLHFPTGLPTGVNAGATLYLEGYRYVGAKGVGPASGLNSKIHMVADTAARDALTVAVGDIVYVGDAGNGEWAAYIANSAGAGATFTQLVDQDASDVDAKTLTETVTFASDPTILLGALSPNRRPVSVAVEVIDPFDTGAEITVGDGGNPARLMAGDESDLETEFVYMTSPVHEYTSETELNVYFTANAATTGEAIVTVTYA